MKIPERTVDCNRVPTAIRFRSHASINRASLSSRHYWLSGSVCAYVAHHIHSLSLSLAVSRAQALLAVGQRAQGRIGARGKAPVQG